jgi:hypothetical protein
MGDSYLTAGILGMHTRPVSTAAGSGIVEIEIGLGDSRLPKSAFTADQMRQAEAIAREQRGHWLVYSYDRNHSTPAAH